MWKKSIFKLLSLSFNNKQQTSMHKQIEPSDAFKSQATKAVLAIALFIIVYILLLVFAVFLTGLCVFLGFTIITTRPSLITLLLGIGIASMGFLVLFFLIKFLFKSHKVDRSHLVEIKKQDEPALFARINEIVKTVDTDFPKKIYLSSDVNASVFYDSSFWSMFLPIKKNLQIGLGLTNCVTKEELSAILSHEFGHFSQKSMKVGSYVYNVNQVIHNLLYDNEGYDRILEGWANATGYFTIFVAGAIKIVQGVQWILQKVYNLVNLSYMALSREMEFHADEIAANVTGSKPLQTSLLRLTLADHSLNTVFGYYESKIKSNIKSPNIYPEQRFVMNHVAQIDNIENKSGFPNVTLEDLNKYNKSKLIIKDQWASHPSTAERISRLEQLNLNNSTNNHDSANDYFTNIEKLQKLFTQKIFDQVQYKGEVANNSFEQFNTDYRDTFENNTFPKMYDGYYNNKNPNHFNLEDQMDTLNNTTFKDLFSDERKSILFSLDSLKNDMEIIDQIANKQFELKTFDYDGKKYKQSESRNLHTQLKVEFAKLDQDVKSHDLKIFKFFLDKETSIGLPPKLKELYKTYFSYDQIFQQRTTLPNKIQESLGFLNLVTPSEIIRHNFDLIQADEKLLKTEIQSLLNDKHYSNIIDTNTKENFDLYLSKDWHYFYDDKYNDNNLNVLITAIQSYQGVLFDRYFSIKKQLLDYQEKLLK